MDRVTKLLKMNRVMTLATSYDNVPRASIVEYSMIGERMMFSTHPDSIKCRNLSANPRISFTVGHMPVYLAVDGTAVEASEKEKEEYIRAMMGVDWRILRISGSAYVEDWNKIMIEKYPEFRKLMESGGLKYYKVNFETAYYTEGTSAAEIIQMGK